MHWNLQLREDVGVGNEVQQLKGIIGVNKGFLN